MWRYIMPVLGILTLATAVYLTSRFARFGWAERLSGGRSWLRLLLAAAAAVLLMGGIWWLMGSFSAMVAYVHLLVFWALCDGVGWLIRRRRGSGEARPRRYSAGAAALALSALYLGTGWYLAHNVWRATYQVTTPKAVEDLRVALIADSHLGTTFDGEGFGRWMEKLQADHPDLLVVAGDFVDDDTSLADMRAACRALGEVETRYGVYYVFGNHDKGYYGDAYRGYGAEELTAELEKNGVTVLRDQTVPLGEGYCLVGRLDRSEAQRGGSRLSMEELTADLDRSRFTIVADHQPQDFAAQAESGVDLVLSGHTHGGWLFPMTVLDRYIGADDLVYGHEVRGDTHFIVTSGISDWAMRFRTGCRSEYVIVDITQAP